MRNPCPFILTVLAGLLAVGNVWSKEVKSLPVKQKGGWCRITSYDEKGTKLPRVLLIGDSITSRYTGAAREALKDKAYVTVLSTSLAVGDPALLNGVKTACSQYTYAAVHFNIGLHGGDGAKAYREGFPDLIGTIRTNAPGAKLIWATTTPCRGEGGMAKRVREYNKIAAEFVEKEGLLVDDLYGLVMKNADNPKVLWDGGGLHFTKEGTVLQGKQVAESILATLPAEP